MIKVVNKKTYIEQGNPYENKQITFYIGRPSIFGNPYSHLFNTLAEYKVDTREQAIEKYREYFYNRFRTDDQFKKEVMHLIHTYIYHENLILICWCSPLSCHGDIIKDFILDYIAIV